MGKALTLSSFNNTFKNGMLPIAIPDHSTINQIAEVARAGKEIEIDLPAQEIRDESGNKLADFEVEEFVSQAMIQCEVHPLNGILIPFRESIAW